jgi:hypothetical protein
MSAYRMPCNEPDFQQTVPAGRWTRVPDPAFPMQYRYRNDDTGETVLVPAIWYNGTPKERATYLRDCADRQDESARHHDGDGKPWSRHEAAAARDRAAKLRSDAAIYEASTASTAGKVEVPR